MRAPASSENMRLLPVRPQEAARTCKSLAHHLDYLKLCDKIAGAADRSTGRMDATKARGRMARQARRNTRGRGQNAAPTGSNLIVIRAVGFERTFDGTQASVEKLAHEWSYILRVRTRWSGDPDMRDYFEQRAIEDLGKLGLKPEDLQQFASADHIEIELRNWRLEPPDAKIKAMFEAASEIPWEYLLSAATNHLGRYQPLLVTRCIPNRTAASQAPPKNMLFVESAPGRIGEEYGFDDEEERIGAAVNLREVKPTDTKTNQLGLHFSQTDALEVLRDKLARNSWDAIHVTGIDTHQAAWLIQGYYDKFDDDTSAESSTSKRKTDIIKSGHLQDGMILRGNRLHPDQGGERQNELPMDYNKLAGLLLTTRRPPAIITLNFYYSGARTARELVRRGAYASLGFLDEIEDEFAELFFQAFYWAWCRDKRNFPNAFLEAWSKMDSDRMHGTSIVIWLGSSMVKQREASSRAARRRSVAGRTR
jgi:hypothetical protein